MKHAFAIIVLLFAAASAFTQSDIRKVDFQNFTYEPSCAGEETTKVTVAGGEFSEEKKVDDYTERFFFKVFNIIHGDLNGDKAEEAVILSVCNTGGTGNFTEGFIFSMKRGKPALASRIPGGDRADGGLRKAWIENGLLVIESNDSEQARGACCPGGTITQKVRLSGGKLLNVGQPIVRDLFPPQRVTFAKGASGATMKLTVSANEGKRLIVGARAGQTLSVSIDTDKASADLDEDADVTNNTNGFSAVLSKSGDYTIRVTNHEDAAVVVTVNIKIN
ncbi:MAG: hypothetical protein WBD16_15940 [Pyrinomonadaceae bacterium]